MRFIVILRYKLSLSKDLVNGQLSRIFCEVQLLGVDGIDNPVLHRDLPWSTTYPAHGDMGKFGPQKTAAKTLSGDWPDSLSDPHVLSSRYVLRLS